MLSGQLTPTDNDVLVAALELRRALDAIDPIYWRRIHIDQFPQGACGHCAELLALYLSEKLGITPDYVSCNLCDDLGNCEQGHAWLEWNGLLVDISGDQFGWEPAIATRTPRAEYQNCRLNGRRAWHFDASFWSQHCSSIWRAAQPFLSS